MYKRQPRESAAELYAKIGRRDADLSMMKEHGVYAPFRLVVAHLLEEEGWTIDSLVDTALDFEAARTLAYDALERTSASEQRR